MARGTVSTMTLVRRFMTMRRDVPAAEGAAAAEPQERKRSFIASNERVDSYNTIIRAAAWERDLEDFRRNPVVLFGHNARELPIAKGDVRVEDSSLLLDADFFPAETNPRSEQVLRVLDAGVMGVSVGFDALEWEYDESRETGDEWMDLVFPPLNYTRVRLLEVSVVTLPANGDALPVGRAGFEQARTRMLQRIEAKASPPTPPRAAIVVEQPKNILAGEQLRALVSEVIHTEVRARRARQRGSLKGD